MNPLAKRLLTVRSTEYLSLDKNFAILEASPGIQRFADCSTAVNPGTDIRSSFPELIGVEDTLLEILREPEANFELKGIRRVLENGSALYFDLYVVQYQSVDEVENCLIILIEDVTEIMLLQQALFQRANELELLLSALKTSKNYINKIIVSMKDVLFVTTNSGKIKTTNPAAENLFGYTEAELLDRPISLIIPDTNFLQESSQIAPSAVQETLQSVEVNCRNKSGEEVAIEFCCSAIETEHEGSQNFVYIGRDITERKRTEAALRLEKEESERLLLNILPLPIAEKLKQQQASIATHYDEATILFADIVDFTGLAAQLSPSDLVDLLNQIFSAFDRLVEYYGLEKIKTIGDAYMVVGGLPIPSTDHAEAIADIALSMQQEIAKFERSDRKPFSLRIGINTGSVVAGVVGLKKFIYDLWGDAVNIASRMESQGESGGIQVTEATYERLKDKYTLQRRGLMHIKGKGEMTTYWLKGKKAPQES